MISNGYLKFKLLHPLAKKISNRPLLFWLESERKRRSESEVEMVSTGIGKRRSNESKAPKQAPNTPVPSMASSMSNY